MSNYTPNRVIVKQLLTPRATAGLGESGLDPFN